MALHHQRLEPWRKRAASRLSILLTIKDHFKTVKFINLSISALGVFSKECSTFMKMLNGVGLDKKHQNFCVKKIMSIAIRTTYYIFVVETRIGPIRT